MIPGPVPELVGGEATGASGKDDRPPGSSHGGAVAYYTNIGPKRGPYLYRDAKYAGAIGVLRARDDHMPIGMAIPGRWDDDGAALWKLTVHGVELEGLWVVVDREFRPAQ